LYLGAQIAEKVSRLVAAIAMLAQVKLRKQRFLLTYTVTGLLQQPKFTFTKKI
jgi:hypothetical protein